MSDKEFKLSARLDDTLLTQDIANLQRKLKTIQESESRLSQGSKLNQNLVNNGMPAMGQYSQQAYQQAYNSNNSQMRQAYAAEVAELGKLEKARESLTKKLEAQNRIQQLMKSNGKDLLEIEQKRAETAERLNQTNDSVSRKQQALNANAKMLRPDMGPGTEMGPPPPNDSAGSGMMGGLMKGIGLGAIVAVVKQVGDDFVRRRMDVLRSSGSAVAGTVGKNLSQMQSGEFAYEGMYGEERGRATEEAKTAESRSRGWDIAKAVGGVGLVAGGLALAPLTAGTSLGASALGLSALGVGGTLLINERGQLDRQKYNAQKAAEYADNYGNALQSNKEMAPFKKDAIEMLQRNGGAYLNHQRSLGINDNEMFSSFQNSGFLPQQTMQASSAILGAGGSTAMAKDSSYALRAERGLNLTNSNQIMGMLSGTQGIPETSKKTLIDIFAQAQSIGLDNSKYAEENRRFMQSVAETVNKGGTTSSTAAEEIARVMGSFTGGSTTMRGLEAGRSAYESYQSQASSTSGYSGALNISSLMTSDSRFKNIEDPAALQEILRRRPDELDPESQDIKAAAIKYKFKTPEEFVKTILKGKEQGVYNSLNRPEQMSKLTQIMAKYRKNNNGSSEGFETRGDLTGVDMLALEGAEGAQHPELDARARRQAIFGLADYDNMSPKEQISYYKKLGKDNIENNDTNRNMDKTMEAAAINAQTSLKTLSENISTFASEAIAAANKMAAATTIARGAFAALDQAQSAETKAAADFSNLHPGMPGYYQAKRNHDQKAADLAKAQDAATASTKTINK
jgi:hypothetical protein